MSTVVVTGHRKVGLFCVFKNKCRLFSHKSKFKKQLKVEYQNTQTKASAVLCHVSCEGSEKVREGRQPPAEVCWGHLNELLHFKARAEHVSLCWNAGDHRKW